MNDYKTESEKIAYLEGMANGVWQVFLTIQKDRWDYCKSYDPLIIDKMSEGYEGHSYIFDFHDGGRHHAFKTLEEIELGLINEIKIELENYKIKEKRLKELEGLK